MFSLSYSIPSKAKSSGYWKMVLSIHFSGTCEAGLSHPSTKNKLNLFSSFLLEKLKVRIKPKYSVVPTDVPNTRGSFGKPCFYLNFRHILISH